MSDQDERAEDRAALLGAPRSPSRSGLAILALDLATNTGWAALDPQGRVTSGTQRFDLAKGETEGVRWLRFRRWLREMLDLTGARLVAREQMLLVALPGAAAKLAAGLHTVVEEELAERGLDGSCVHAGTLKKWATGRGNAKKPDMIAEAERRYGLTGLTHDRADALLILAWAREDAGA